MVSNLASDPLTSVVQVVPTEDAAAAERWHQWQLQNVLTSRADARRAHIAFALIFVATGAWLGLQLLAPSFWP